MKFNIKFGQIKPSYWLVMALFFVMPMAFAKKSDKILIFSKTAKYHHQSIAAGIQAIIKLAEENGFVADTTTNSKKFTTENLKHYSAVIFLSTTGDVLNNEQQQVFENYIKAGGGFVGVHAATDCEYDWAWYGNLVGAYFSNHPKQQEAVLKVTNKKHLSTKHLPEEWKRKDEWYNYKWMAPDLNVLITIDETSYDAGKGKMGANHPMAWYHDFDGGRAFYTALGHTDESFKEEAFLKHLLGGIKYAMGKKK
ncbi:ThuA domain-containing protein [Flavobacterium sp. UMI-01]|uniref:ThuA domain-containing protein n=1 Tax=Flavobacterium sp. UMI-01 TaxID=1441053 RepID=UPI002106FB8D|nr:ThuA domain-containing protein [Flavobacterium sp. UMI-01]